MVSFFSEVYHDNTIANNDKRSNNDNSLMIFQRNIALPKNKTKIMPVSHNLVWGLIVLWKIKFIDPLRSLYRRR